MWHVAISCKRPAKFEGPIFGSAFFLTKSSSKTNISGLKWPEGIIMDEDKKPGRKLIDPETDISRYVMHHRKRWGNNLWPEKHYALTTGDPNSKPFDQAVQGAQIYLNDKNRMGTYQDSYPVYRAKYYDEYVKHLGIERDIKPENIAPTNGATHGYTLAMETMFGRDDVVAIPVPTYGFFLDPATTGHTHIMPIHLREEDGYRLTPEHLDSEIKRINAQLKKQCDDEILSIDKPLRVTGFVNINPHNPTGIVYTKDELKPLAEVLQRNGVEKVIDDMAYAGLEYGHGKEYPNPRFAGAVAGVPDMFDKTVTLLTLSKAYGVAGMRAGAVIGPKDLIGPIRKIIGKREEFLPMPSQGAFVRTIMDAFKSSREKYLGDQADNFRFRHYLLRAMINGWDNDHEARTYFQREGMSDPTAVSQYLYKDNTITPGQDITPEQISSFFKWLESHHENHYTWLKEFAWSRDIFAHLLDPKTSGSMLEEINQIISRRSDFEPVTQKKYDKLLHIIEEYNFLGREMPGKLKTILKQGMPELEALKISEAGFFLLVDASKLKGRYIGPDTMKDAGDIARKLLSISGVGTLPGEAMGEYKGKALLRISFSDKARDLVEAMAGIDGFMSHIDGMSDDSMRVYHDMKRMGPEEKTALEKMLSKHFGAGRER
jgi:aspartate/methionine/tyrosine aminotransferase